MSVLSCNIMTRSDRGRKFRICQEPETCLLLCSVRLYVESLGYRNNILHGLQYGSFNYVANHIIVAATGFTHTQNINIHFLHVGAMLCAFPGSYNLVTFHILIFNIWLMIFGQGFRWLTTLKALSMFLSDIGLRLPRSVRLAV